MTEVRRKFEEYKINSLTDLIGIVIIKTSNKYFVQFIKSA